MLTPIPDMTFAGRIPLDVPLGTLPVVAMLAFLALGLASELGALTALRSLARRRPREARAPRVGAATAAPRS